MPRVVRSWGKLVDNKNVSAKRLLGFRQRQLGIIGSPCSQILSVFYSPKETPSMNDEIR